MSRGVLLFWYLLILSVMVLGIWRLGEIIAWVITLPIASQTIGTR